MITGTRDSGKCFPHKRFRSSHYGTAGRMLKLQAAEPGDRALLGLSVDEQQL
jgi:hypothetical protein